VLHTGAASKSSEIQWMDVLWVCWFGYDMWYKSDFEAKCLHHIGFVLRSDSLGFLDLKEIVWAVHYEGPHWTKIKNSHFRARSHQINTYLTFQIAQ